MGSKKSYTMKMNSTKIGKTCERCGIRFPKSSINPKLRQVSSRTYVCKEETITYTVEIAEKFNDFFINKGPTINNEIKHIGSNDYETYPNQNIMTSFHFERIDNESLRKTLNNLRSKSSSGHDGISMCLLKYLSLVLINALRVIINQSLITGIYPNN